MLLPFGMKAQKNEAELIKMANKLFDQEKYVEATPLFSQLLSNNATSPEYNYKYGTCLLFSEGEKATGLKHILFASQNPNVPKECWYFLGKGYHLNYQFGEAIKAYQKFAATATPKEMEKYQVNRQIEMCNNGKKLLRNITDMVVLDKRDIGEGQFFRLYSMDNIGGQLIVVEALQSSLDKKNEHKIVIHNPRNSDVVFYSSYGSDGKNGLDIYKVKRLPNGEWANPQIVRGFINTPYDENYPYMHPDGRTLYFCSKGHNSMGGYDVFRSIYDPESDQFSAPENVDFAISSPDDDLLYIVDSLDRVAWFASKRESENGKIHVYNVRVERIPVLMAIIKGKFISEVSPENLGATIRIEDMASNEVVGIYNTKSSDGNYLITLPKSGKYKFTVVSDNSKIAHVGVVEVPYQKELRPLKQELVLVNNNGTEQLKIRNLFDQQVDDSDAIIAQILKDKSILTPNLADFDLDSLDKARSNKKDTLPDEQLGDLTDKDLVDLVKKDVEELSKEAAELKDKMEAAYVVADRKNDQAKEKSKEAEELLIRLKNISDEQEKKQVIADANNLNDESKKLITESAAAYEVAKNLEEQHKKKEQDVKIASEFASGIETAVNTKNRSEAEKKLREQQQYIQSVMEAEPNRQDELDELREKSLQKKQEADKAMAYAQELRKEEEKLNVELNSLKRQQEAAKNEKKKQEFQEEIDRKTEDHNAIKSDIKTAFNKFEMLQQESEILSSQVNVLEEIQSGNVTGTLSESEKNALAQDLNSGETNKIFEQNDRLLAETNKAQRYDREKLNKYLHDNPVYKGLFAREEKVAAIADRKTQLEEENKLGEEWVSTIDKDVQSLTEKMDRERDPAKQSELKEQIAALEELKQEKKDNILANQKKLSELQSVAVNTDVVNENKVDPQYNEKLNEIRNSQGDNKEKLSKENELNRELLSSIDEKINQNNSRLTTVDPQEREQLEKENRELNRLKEQKNEEIRANERKMSNSVAENESVLADVNKLDPKYEASKNKIASSDISEAEKLKEENKLNTSLITKIDKEIAAVNKKLEKANPDEKNVLEKQKQELQNLKSKTENDIKANNGEIARLNNPVNTNVTSTNNQELISSIDPQYEQNKKEIENSGSSPQDKLRAENELNKKLIASIDEKIKEKQEKINTGSPEEKIIAQQEIAQLEKIKAEKEQLVAGNEKRIESIESGVAVDENSVRNTEVASGTGIQKVDPSYATELHSIENSEISALEKAEQRLNLNRNSLNKVQEEKRKAEQEGDNNKVDELNKLEEQLQALIRKDESLMQGNVATNTLATEKNEKTATTVDPAYNKQLESITGSSKSEIRKLNEVRELNEALVRKTDNEIAKLEKDLEQGNVADPEVTRKRIEELKEFRSDKEAEIAGADRKLAESGVDRVDENGRSVSGYAFMPEYESPEAQSRIASIQPLIDQVRKTEDELTELKLQRAESNNETEKSQITTRIIALEEKLVKLELEIAAKVQEANALEKKEMESQLALIKAETKKLKVPEDNADLIAARRMEEKAKLKFEDAKKLRAEASKEKDEKRKNLLLMKANVAEQLGNKFLNAAENAYSKANASSSGVDPERSSISVGELYPEYFREMEKAGTTSGELDAVQERIRLNKELIRRIDEQIAQYASSTDAQSEAKRKKLEELKKLKESELKTDEAKVAQLAANPVMSNETRTLVSTVDPAYVGELEKINASAASELRKNQERIALNEELLSKVEDEVVKSRSLIATTTDETIRETETQRLEQLERLKIEKQNEINASSVRLTETGVLAANAHPERNYEKNDDYTSEKAKNEISGVATQLNEIEKTRSELEELKIRRAESTDKNEQKKLDKEIKAIEADLLIRETNVAASFSTANAAEREALEKSIAEKKKETEYKSIAAGHPALVRVGELEKMALTGFETAAALRQKAAAEKDKNKKNEWLKEAAYNEKLANEKLAEAEQLLKVLLGESQLASNNQQTNTLQQQNNQQENNSQQANNNQQNNNTNNTQQLTSEQLADPANRKSTEQFTEAQRLKQESEELMSRAAFLEDSSKTVKKKYRQAILDEAAQKRILAQELSQKSDETLSMANESKRTEDLQIAEQIQKEEQERLRKEQESELIKTTEYARYYALKIESKRLNDVAAKTEIEYGKQQEIAGNLRNEVKTIRNQASTEADNQRKNQLLTQASNLERQAIAMERKQDSLRNLATQQRNAAQIAEERAENYLAGIDPVKAGQLKTIAQQTVLPQPELQQTSVTATAIASMSPEEVARNFSVPDRVETEIYKKSDRAVYSAEHPIPVDAKMPEGVYFKVQVGAFRNEIDPATFKEFAPITGERTAAGLTRYTVGYFTTFNTANAAKTEIRGMGYNDAFVVGFRDGKRIPLNEAMAALGDGTLANNQQQNNNQQQQGNNQQQQGNNQQQQENTNQQQGNNQQEYVNNFNPDLNAASYYTTEPGAAKANQVEVISGLFFTVQVGVYSKPVKADQIFNINPLNSEKTANNQIRYTSGIYTDLAAAGQRRDQIREIGVSDAFVTAYMNGKRITVAQARDSIAKYGNSVYVKDAGLINHSTTDNQQQNNQQTNNNQQQNNQQQNNQQQNNQQTVPESASGYKVILGQYEKEVPAKEAEIYLNNLSYGIRKASTGDGKTIYFIDNVATKTEAFNIADNFIQKGLSGAYVSDKLPQSGGSNPSVTEAKPASGVKFQVYIGEFIGDVPPEATEVYLNNYDKGVKRKKGADNAIIYYVLDGESYDEALKMKAHFIGEGLSSVRIVAFSEGKEIPLSSAYTAGMRYNVIIAEYSGEMPDEVKEATENIAEISVRTRNLPDGFTVAYAEGISDLDRALRVKARLIAEGLSTVRVVVIKDGKEISLSEAIQAVYE